MIASKETDNKHSGENTPQVREPRAYGRLAALALMVAGFAGGAIHEKIEDNHQAQETRIETKDMLKKQGTHLTLASGEVAVIKGLDFTEQQITAAHKVKAPNADVSSAIKGDTFLVDTEKTRKSSSGGLSIMPWGVAGPSVLATPGKTTTETVKYDDTVLQHIDRDDVNRDKLDVFISSTENVEGVSARLYYDQESEDLILRAYYDKESPNDRVEYLAVIEGLENQ